jgi:hypothetical protein
MRRRSHNEPKEGGKGFLGLGKDRESQHLSNDKKFARRQRETPTTLDEVVVTADAPRWLNYRRQYEIENPKDAFLEKNITGFDRSLGTTKRNYPKRLDKQYDKRANDYVAEQLIAEYETKYGNKPRRLRTAEERLGIYDYYNEQERDILKNSKHASWYLPAERQHRIRVSDNPDRYVKNPKSFGTEDFTDRDSNNMEWQHLSNSVEGTPERFRVFSNAGNDLESYINPAMWIGEMARSLGQAPLKAQQSGSMLPVIGAFAEPLLSGIPLTTIGKKAKKAVGENRVDTAVDILKNFRKEVDPYFKEPRQAALEGANKIQEKYYNSDGFNRRLEKLKAEQKREFRDAVTRNVLKRGSALDDLKEVMDVGEIGDYIVHNLSPVDNWDYIQRNAENKKYLAFFESNKNRLKNFKENKESVLNYDEGYAKGRAGGISGWKLDSNLDPHVRHDLVDHRLSTEDINRIAFHEGNHGLTNGNQLLNKQTKDLLQSPFDLTDVHPRKGNDYVNRKSYILDPTEIYARIQEMRLHSSHGNFQGLNQYDKINLRNRAYGPLDNNLKSKIDPIFWNSVKDWDKLIDVMNKMPAIAGAGLGLHALQNQNPEQFKKGGIVGGPDDPPKGEKQARQFINNYMLSPHYLNRLAKTHSNAEEERAQRFLNVITAPIEAEDPNKNKDSFGYYNAYSHNIKVDKNRVNDYEVPLHELTHAQTKGTRRYNEKELQFFKDNIITPKEYNDPWRSDGNYATNPTEVHARLNNIRKFALDNKYVKDLGDITPEIADKIIDHYYTSDFKETFKKASVEFDAWDSKFRKYKESKKSNMYSDEEIEKVLGKRPVFSDLLDKYKLYKPQDVDMLLDVLKGNRGVSLSNLWNNISDSSSKKIIPIAEKGGFVDGGFINNNMTDPNNYLWNMLMKMQQGVQSGQFLNMAQDRQGNPTPPIPSLPIKPLDPDIKPNWPPGSEVPNNPDQPYRPQVKPPQSIASLPIKSLEIPKRKMEEPNPDNIQYSLSDPNPKQRDPLIGGMLVGAGATGATMANIGRPDVGLGTLSGMATGAGYGAMFGPVGAAIGGVIGGIGGFASTGLNRTRYDEQSSEMQKGKIKAATIYGGDVGNFEFGGNVYAADGEEIVPIQTERGEKIVTPDGYIHTSKAKQLHKHMDKDLVTDILPEGSYVASNSRAMQILRDKANKMVMGYDTVEYLEGGGSPIPKEHTLGEIMKKKKMTPAEILDIVKNKFPTNQIEYDQFAKKANVLNLKSRLPYINAVISASKKS